MVRPLTVPADRPLKHEPTLYAAAARRLTGWDICLNSRPIDGAFLSAHSPAHQCGACPILTAAVQWQCFRPRYNAEIGHCFAAHSQCRAVTLRAVAPICFYR